MKLLLLGMNHRTAPLELREQFAAADPGPLLQKLVGCDEIDEALLISTCNRVELVATTHQLEPARHRLRRFFEEDLAGAANAQTKVSIDSCTYEFRDSDAMRHIFRVASAMDSMVVGEPQILGQMKDAYRQAVELSTCGPILARLFQRAFATAKRVKNETGIAQRPTSVARVAVDLAKQIFEDLRNKTALLIGAGEMIETAMLALQHEGLSQLFVANRTRARAEGLAERFGAIPHDLADLELLLARADVVLTCIGVSEPILDVALLDRVLRQRRNRPIFVIDIGVPRNVAPDVNDFDSVYLYDIDDLQEVAQSNTERRMQEASRAEAIVLEEQQRFDGWLVALRAVPTIRHLKARAEAVRESELERHLGRLELSEDQRAGVESLTRALVNKLLHAPLSRLRSETDGDEGLATLEAARELFALDDPEAPGAHADAEVWEETAREQLLAEALAEDEDDR